MYADRALVPIRDAIRRQREFAADASHELRTPSYGRQSGSARRPAADSTADHPVARSAAAIDDIEAGLDRLTALVDDLLVLARRTPGGGFELEPADLGDLGDLAIDAVGGLAGVAGSISVRLEIDAESSARGRPGAPPTARRAPRRQRDQSRGDGVAGRSSSARGFDGARSSRSRTTARASARRTCRTSSTASGVPRTRPRAGPDWASRSRTGSSTATAGRIVGREPPVRGAPASRCLPSVTRTGGRSIFRVASRPFRVESNLRQGGADRAPTNMHLIPTLGGSQGLARRGSGAEHGGHRRCSGVATLPHERRPSVATLDDPAAKRRFPRHAVCPDGPAGGVPRLRRVHARQRHRHARPAGLDEGGGKFSVGISGAARHGRPRQRGVPGGERGLPAAARERDRRGRRPELSPRTKRPCSSSPSACASTASTCPTPARERHGLPGRRP